MAAATNITSVTDDEMLDAMTIAFDVVGLTTVDDDAADRRVADLVRVAGPGRAAGSVAIVARHLLDNLIGALEHAGQPTTPEAVLDAARLAWRGHFLESDGTG